MAIVFERIEPQPPEGYRSMVRDCDPKGGWWFSDIPHRPGVSFELSEFAKWQHVYPKCPHGKPGDLYGVREECTLGHGGDGEPVVAQFFREGYVTGYVWHPDAPPEARNWCMRWHRCNAVDMPDWAIRTRLPILSITVVRAGEVSEGTAQLAGFEFHHNSFGDDLTCKGSLLRHFGGPEVWLWKIATHPAEEPK